MLMSEKCLINNQLIIVILDIELPAYLFER